MSARTSRSIFLAAMVALLALVAAGCGGSSGSTNTATVSLKSAMAGMSSEGSGGESEGMEGMEGMSESEGKSEDASSEPEVMEGPTGMLMEATNATGSAEIEQKGDKLTGTITVSGLEPNSRHAAHLHGPDGSCEPKKMVTNMAVVLPELVANSKGVATAKFDFTVHQQVVEKGYYIMVHAEGNPPSMRGEIGTAPASPTYMQALSKDPGILCGDVEVKN